MPRAKCVRYRGHLCSFTLTVISQLVVKKKGPQRQEALIEFSKYTRAQLEQARQNEKVRICTLLLCKSSKFFRMLQMQAHSSGVIRLCYDPKESIHQEPDISPSLSFPSSRLSLIQ